MKYLLFVLILLAHSALAEDIADIASCKDISEQSNSQEAPCLSEKITVEENKERFPLQSSDYSMWLELNYTATQYSALLESIEVTESNSDGPFWWFSYNVKAKVIDVYNGDLKRGETIDLIVYISVLSSKRIQHLIKNKFIFSFCQANSGVYYNSQDFLVQQPSVANIAKMRDIKKFGTKFEGDGDCTGNYPELNPDLYE